MGRRNTRQLNGFWLYSIKVTKSLSFSIESPKIHVRLVKKPGYERATAKTRLNHIIPFLLSYSRWLYSRCADLTRGDPIACASLLTFSITSTAFDLLT